MKIYLVGGAVRDKVLGLPVKDEDFVVVGSTEQEMLDKGYTKVGADFPVFLDSHGREFALARQERKTGAGYHGFETKFSPDVTLESDLIRRDLTCNAMAQEVLDIFDDGQIVASDTIIDPYDGQKDIEQGVLRHVSQAFAEDPVRVLRVARFAARYNFQIAPETLDLMTKLTSSGELNHLTPERVWKEVDKAIQENYPNHFFWALRKCGALDVLAPELARTILEFTGRVSTCALYKRDWVVRWLMVCSELTQVEAVQLMKRWKAPTTINVSVKKYILLRNVVRSDVAIELRDSWEATPESIMELFKQTDALRNDRSFMDVAQAMRPVLNVLEVLRLDKVMQALRRVNEITFASLSPSVQHAGGKVVGEALLEKRVEAIRPLL